MTSLGKYAKESFWAIASKASAFVFYYALVFYLIHRMTVDVWGEWSAFLALLNIVMLTSDQGINAASKRYLAQARGTDDFGGVVRVTLLLRVLASVAFVVGLLFIVRPLLTSLHQAGNVRLMEQSVVLIALYGVMEYFKSLFEAIHRLRFTFTVNLVEHGLKLLLVVTLFRSGGQFFVIIASFTAAVAVALATGALISLRQFRGFITSPAPPGLMSRVYRYSLPVFLMSIGGFAALEVDTLMLNFLRTPYDTGIYAAAKNIVMYLPHVGLALSMGTIPGLAVFTPADALERRRTYHRLLSVVLGVYILIAIAVGAFAIWGVRDFFAPAYQAASRPLLLLIPFVILSGLSSYSAQLLDYRGLAWIRSANFGVTIVANILLNWWLIPKWGAAGAAAASSLAFIPYCLFNLWQADAAFHIKEQPIS